MRKHPIPFLAAALVLAAVSLAGCRSGPSTADEGSTCRTPDARMAAEATGELSTAQGAQAVGPEAATSQGRKSLGVSPAVGVNRGQGDNVTTASNFDGSATVSAGAPAVVQTLFGAMASNANASGGSADGDVALSAYREELAGIRTRALGPIGDEERKRLEVRADAILAEIAKIAAARSEVAKAAATAPPPSFPNLTTVVFSNASGSSAGSDKAAVDPANAEALSKGLPALVEQARRKTGP